MVALSSRPNAGNALFTIRLVDAYRHDDTAQGPDSKELRGNVGPFRVSQTGWTWAAKLEIRPSERKENEITKLHQASSRGQASN